jgi:small subunit ribosomal protein S19
MSRSKWKRPFQDLQTIKSIKFSSRLVEQPKSGVSIDSDKAPLSIYSRSSTISKFFINKLVHVYTGKELKKVYISSDHIGYKFGEFAPTRKKHVVIKKKSADQKKKKNSTK